MKDIEYSFYTNCLTLFVEFNFLFLCLIDLLFIFTTFMIALPSDELLNIDIWSIDYWNWRNQQTVIFHWSLSMVTFLLSHSSFLSFTRESFPSVLFSFTLSPTHSFFFLTSLFDFFYNQSVHSWFYEIVELSRLSCLPTFFSVVSCKFRGVLLIAMKYINVFHIIVFIWYIVICPYQLTYVQTNNIN